MSELCGFLWLPSSELRCTLEPHGPEVMHYAKYRIDYEQVEFSSEGDLWWNGEQLELEAK